VEKNNFNKNLFRIENSIKKDRLNFQAKTTNVNILLNRVRLEKKKDLSKQIFTSLCLITSVSLLAVFLII